MSKISIPGIIVGVLIGFVLWCIVLVIHYVSKRRLLKGIRGIFIGMVFIGLTVFIAFTMGNYMGYSLKEGDYSDRSCYVTRCEEPSCCKINMSMGMIQYYCEEHLDVAYSMVDGMINFETLDGEKCGSCGNRYTDDDNLKSLSRTNLCKKCYGNYKSMEGLKD